MPFPGLSENGASAPEHANVYGGFSPSALTSLPLRVGLSLSHAPLSSEEAPQLPRPALFAKVAAPSLSLSLFLQETEVALRGLCAAVETPAPGGASKQLPVTLKRILKLPWGAANWAFRGCRAAAPLLGSLR